MANTVLAALRAQWQVWAWALIVGLFLVLVGRAPIGPVLTGAVLAASLATVRSWRKSRFRAVSLPDDH
jgi:hypothetical protein